jgi:GNAT superfamily N-acetyltransferase
VAPRAPHDEGRVPPLTGLTIAEIRELDALAARATAASLDVPLDGWVLRATADLPFRRSNTVAPNGEVADLDAAIAAVERFYGERDLPVRFQLSPAALPPGLDGVLAARGYEVEAPVVIALAETTTVIARTEDRAGDARVASGIDEAWVEQYARIHGEDDVWRDRIRGYGHMLGGLGLDTAAAVTGPDPSAPVGLGFAVADSGWVGIFGMGTRPEARRRGAATAVLHGLAAWAAEHGAARLYLQVEDENTAARALYARAGFTDAYGYHYRTRFRPG